SSRRRHTRLQGDWSSDVCSSDLGVGSYGYSTSLLLASSIFQTAQASTFPSMRAATGNACSARSDPSRGTRIRLNIPYVSFQEHRSEERRVGKECRSRL